MSNQSPSENQNKIIVQDNMSNIKLVEQKKVKSHYDADKEVWYFSVIDVIEILTDSPRPRKYWSALKTKLTAEGSQVSQKLGQLKISIKIKNILQNG